MRRNAWSEGGAATEADLMNIINQLRTAAQKRDGKDTDQQFYNVRHGVVKRGQFSPSGLLDALSQQMQEKHLGTLDSASFPLQDGAKSPTALGDGCNPGPDC